MQICWRPVLALWRNCSKGVGRLIEVDQLVLATTKPDDLLGKDGDCQLLPSLTVRSCVKVEYGHGHECLARQNNDLAVSVSHFVKYSSFASCLFVPKQLGLLHTALP